MSDSYFDKLHFLHFYFNLKRKNYNALVQRKNWILNGKKGGTFRRCKKIGHSKVYSFSNRNMLNIYLLFSFVYLEVSAIQSFMSFCSPYRE